MFCPDCGTNNKADANFCEKCGKRLKKSITLHCCRYCSSYYCCYRSIICI
ncbi:MAG: hypothetical protein CVV28_09975 [Methanobacteriales archaeon HGW-Methanobacteriales-1]|nr:MAG: hypothetical protein CVV28_09975 [Methanobacteriales archaeon HGW-Methanobacteriales-1]